MSDELVRAHYGKGDVAERIRNALVAAGKDPRSITREDLGGIDQLHGGGLEATRGLARMAGVKSGLHVLDVGSGLGGPARTLAAEFGATVTGVDLTEEFCEVATALTELVGLQGVQFYCASALALPFDDATFDMAWTQNVLMNIADKAGVLREVHRVLRPGGIFALQSVTAGAGEPHFPTPWAADATTNHLVPQEEFRALSEEMGFDILRWEPGPAPQPPATGPRSVFLTQELSEAQRNSMQRNFEEGRTSNLFAVLQRS